MVDLPNTGFLKLQQIVGKRAISAEEAARNKSLGKGPRRPHGGFPGVFPVSRTTWYDGIAKGIYPRSPSDLRFCMGCLDGIGETRASAGLQPSRHTVFCLDGLGGFKRNR